MAMQSIPWFQSDLCYGPLVSNSKELFTVADPGLGQELARKMKCIVLRILFLQGRQGNPLAHSSWIRCWLITALLTFLMKSLNPGREGQYFAQCKRAPGSFIQWELMSLKSLSDPGVPKRFNTCKDMSHFAYACKMRYPFNLVLESWEYLWFYWTFCIVILDYGLKLHKLSNHTLVMLQKWLEIH